MLYTYRILKSSWGIAIFLEMQVTPLSEQSAIKITDKIYLLVKDKARLSEEEIIYWFSEMIHKNYDIINFILPKYSTYFVIDSIKFNYVDFQEEALYNTFAGWFETFYNIKLHMQDVIFDEKKNKYIFFD